MSKFITIHDANAGGRSVEKTINTDHVILVEDSTRQERYGRIYVKDAGRVDEYGWTTRVIDTQETYRELKGLIRDRIGTKNPENSPSDPQ